MPTLFGDERLSSPTNPISYFSGPQDLIDFLEYRIRFSHGLAEDREALIRVQHYLLACWKATSAATCGASWAAETGATTFASGTLTAAQQAAIQNQMGTVVRRPTNTAGNRWMPTR